MVLIAPDGQRITGENADSPGYLRSSISYLAPLGSTDGGQGTTINFTAPGKSGDYGIDLTGRNLKKTENAKVLFRSKRERDAFLGNERTRRTWPRARVSPRLKDSYCRAMGSTMEEASPGRYRFDLEAAGPAAATATAAFLPLGRTFSEANRSDKPPSQQAPAGDVRIVSYGLPYDCCFVGDKLGLAFRIQGDVDVSSLRFRTLAEYQSTTATPASLVRR